MLVLMTSEPNTEGDHDISTDETLQILDKILVVSNQVRKLGYDHK